MLPLVGHPEKPFFSGWCSYQSQLEESPDIEIFSGGINTKSVSAAALWRQGHLMHFGFDLAPSDMNDAGQALLLNSIVYISKYSQDRAILMVPSPFAGKGTRSRDSLEGWLKKESYPVEWFESAIADEAIGGVEPKTREHYQEWYAATRRYLHPGEGGKLTIDQEARALGVNYDEPGFFSETVSKLGDATLGSAARTLLARYVPGGPGAQATPAAWRAWYEVHAPYLFFSEWGGYRWYVDPLAKARRIPTAKLRGSKRADIVAPSKTTSNSGGD